METMNKARNRQDVMRCLRNDSSFEVPALPEGTGLQPQLDSIFADVQASLPSIDFDASDVSSDEETAIVSRSFKSHTTFSENANRDPEMSPETWRSVLEPSPHNDDYSIHTDVFHDYSHLDSPSNSSTAELLLLDPSILEVGVAQRRTVDKEASFRTVRSDASVQNWSDIKCTLGIRESGWEGISADASRTDTASRTRNNAGILRQALSGDDPTAATTSVFYRGENQTSETQIGLDTATITRSIEQGPSAATTTLDESQERRPSTDLEISKKISSLIPTEVPSLAMDNVDYIDLDLLLDCFPVVGRSVGTTEKGKEPINSQTGGGDGNQTDSACPSLMEKLAQLCVQQSAGTLDKTQLLDSHQGRPAPRVTAAAQTSENYPRMGSQRGHQGRKSPPREAWAERTTAATRDARNRRAIGTSTRVNVATFASQTSHTVSVGVSTQSWSQVGRTTHSGGGSKNIERRETIFLDLRTSPEPKEVKTVDSSVPEAVKRILKLNLPGESDSSDESDEEDMAAWRKARKQGLQQRPSPPIVKKKQEPRSVVQSSIITVTGTVQEKPLIKKPTSTPTARLTHDVTPPRLEQPPTACPVPATPPSSPIASSIQESQVPARQQHHLLQEETGRKLIRERRERERATRLRLQKQLDALRPRHSASEKRPAARVTPIIYDLEASYTPPHDCLPPMLQPNQECAMLTINLSTSGEVTTHHRWSSSSGAGRTLGNATGSVDQHHTQVSITFSVLLAWLLSLVPPDFQYLADGSTATPRTTPVPESMATPETTPFRVVGLRQAYHEGRLVLNVAVTPTSMDATNLKLLLKRKKKAKGLEKEEIRDSTLFQQHVSKFLQISTLPELCPWVRDAFSYAVGDVTAPPCSEDDPARDTVREDGSYIPPLPPIDSKPLSAFVTVGTDRDAARRVFAGDRPPMTFFWQTVDLDDDEVLSVQASSEDYDRHTDVQNTMSLVHGSIYRNPKQMLGFLHRIQQEGLDVSGLRLLYRRDEPHARENGGSGSQDHIDKVEPILAVAIRGNAARTRWLDAVGPSDPQLARRTDPRSLMAMFGGGAAAATTRGDVPPISCPRNPTRVGHELALWFGGRVPEDGAVDVAGTSVYRLKEGESATRGRSAGLKAKKAGRRGGLQADVDDAELNKHILESTSRPSMLVATTQCDIFLVVSPIVPPICVGSILSECQVRGYQLRGARRLRLNGQRVSALGLTGSRVHAFNPVSCTTPTSPGRSIDGPVRDRLDTGFPTANPSPMPSMVLLLRQENGMHHAASLIEAVMGNLCLSGMLTTIKENSPSGTLTAGHCFHVAPYSVSLFHHLGGDLTAVPAGNSGPYLGPFGWPASITSQVYTNPELEQIVVITFSGTGALTTAGSTLTRLLGLYPLTPTSPHPPTHSPSSSTAVGQGLELLGLKWIALLTSFQAKELTPYEVGDHHWRSSVQALTSRPALVCVVRGLKAPALAQSILGTPSLSGSLPGKSMINLDRIVSTCPEASVHQVLMFFRDQELFADPAMRVNLPFLPPLRSPSLEELSTARFSWFDVESTTQPPRRRGRGKGGVKPGKGMLVVEESIYKAMLVGRRLLTTVAVVKPLAFRKHLSKIFKRIAQENFTVVALNLTILSTEQARALVPKGDCENHLLRSMHVDHMTSGPVLVLVLQRENAVKKLLDLLGPDNPREAREQSPFLWRGMYGSDPISSGMHGSESYTAAVREQKLLFPDGLCCRETPDLQADQIVCPAVDSIVSSRSSMKRSFVVKPYEDSLLSPVTSTHSLMSISSGSSTSSADLLLGPSRHSALCQTNCLLLTPPLLLTKVKGYYRGHVEVVHALHVHGFAVVGMRMVWLTEAQAGDFNGVYSRAFANLVRILCHGPSIAIAVQRDNAVSCFDTLLGSSFDKESVISKYGEHILRPKDTREASKHLEFFFDRLMSQSHGEIITEEAQPI